MDEKNKQFTPEGWHTLTPRIVVDNAKGFVEFLREVFGAEGTYQPDRPAVMKIGVSLIMVSETGGRSPTPAFIYVYVKDVDEIYQRALQAGASSIEEPAETPYGDRRGMVEDEWGNTWQIATYKGFKIKANS